MKKPFLYGVLAASLFTVNTLQPIHAQSPVAPAPSGTFDGKVRVEQGKKYNLRIFMRSKSTQTFPESILGKKMRLKKMETVSIIKFDADYDIVSVDAQGNHQVRVTYGDFSVDMSLFADGRPQPTAQKAAAKKYMDEYLKVMKGATFLIKISPSNKVFSTYGLDAMRARIMKQLSDIPPDAQAGLDAMLSGYLSDKSASKNWGNLGGELPTQPVRVSESWNYTTPNPISTGFDSTVEGVRTLVSLKDGVAALKDTGTFVLKGSGIGKAIPNAPVMDISGTQTAITHVTNATGMPLDSTISQVMSGTVDVPLSQKDKEQKFQVSLSAVKEMRFVMEEK